MSTVQITAFQTGSKNNLGSSRSSKHEAMHWYKIAVCVFTPKSASSQKSERLVKTRRSAVVTNL